LQHGDKLSMPHSRPMPSIGPHCHELRITDSDKIWRIVYRIDADAIVVGDVFQKTTAATPKKIFDVCKSRFRMYDDAND
jgi:phage-related protein